MKKSVIDNRYKVLKKLGVGAMGEVYQVTDLKDNCIIALKILSKQMSASEEAQRFKREFKLLAELHHPNLCAVYDFGTLKDGRSYFTMEYIDGPNIFDASKNLSYEEIYPLIVELCRALAYIHAKGLIHYDIKPGNVLIQKANGSSVVKLMDFGLADEQQIKGGELIKGTFPYIAPEVIKGLAVDHRADLYSLGVLLYEIFTGRQFAVEGKASFVTFLKQSKDLISELPSKIVADIPKGLERLILKLIAFDPPERFSRANEVIKSISKIADFKFQMETEKTIEGYLLGSKFVGRDKEMDTLKSLYEKAQHGESKVVLITGDAGIGKSRLLKEFRVFTQIERRHCFTGSTSQDKIGPLTPFYDVFSELINHLKAGPSLSRNIKFSLAVLFKIFPELTDGHLRKNLPRLVPLEPEPEKLRNFEALSELVRHIASELGELVILLEDLHWADDLTLQFLEYLGRNLEGRNIFVCGTCRRGELAENPTLKKMMANLRDEGYFSLVELKPFNFKSLYAFLDSTITPQSNSSELVKYLMEKTSGNPFFVEEIMRALMRMRGISIGEKFEIETLRRVSIPETIEDVVLKRTKDLDHAAQRVTKFAAILLSDFSYDLMKRLTDLDDTELSKVLWDLKSRQVLVEEDNRYRFYHPTLREAVLKRLRDKERRELHYKVGKVLEQINKGNLEKIIEDLAYYFINARDLKKGIRYGLMAAARSSNRYANEQAIWFYKGVALLLPDKDRTQLSDILVKLATIIKIFKSDAKEAIKYYNRALKLKVGSIEKEVKIHLEIANTYDVQGEFNKALNIYQKAFQLLGRMKPGRFKDLLKVYINVKMRKVYLYAGDIENADAFNPNTLKLLKNMRRKDTMRLQSAIYQNLGIIEIDKCAYGRGDYNKAISYYKESYRRYRMTEDKDGISGILNQLGITYYYCKFDFRKAYDCFHKSIQIAEKIEDQYMVSVGLVNFGDMFRTKACYSNGLECYERALAISRKISNPAVASHSLLGMGNCFLGLCDYKKAKEYSRKALEIFDSLDWTEKKVYPLRNMGNVHETWGDYTLALELYKKALKISKDSGNQYHIAYLLSDISSVFIDLGRTLKSRRYAEDALSIATNIRRKDLQLKCHIILCLISLIKNDSIIDRYFYKNEIKIVKKLGLKRELLQFLLLLSEIDYHKQKYLEGIVVANRVAKAAKAMGTKDLYIEALLLKVKNGIRQGILAKSEVVGILDEAKKIAEEIGCPEIIWKVYFEYGKFFQHHKDYLRALQYYKQCVTVFIDVSGRIKQKSYKESYLNRPDRQLVYAAIDEVERITESH